MAHILVCEDSPTQAEQIRLLLEEAGFVVETAPNGRVALESIAARMPELVLTDLDMPELNGLELVEAVRVAYPALPVVLITQFGSEEIAVEALQKGAAGYVPKRNLVRDIISTIDDVLAVASARQHHEQALQYLERTEARFVIGNDDDVITPLIGQLQQDLLRWR